MREKSLDKRVLLWYDNNVNKRLLRLTENVAYHGGAGELAGCARADRLGTRTVLG